MVNVNSRTNHTVATGGFSLVEVMIVVCIIGILAAIAVPFYRGYIAISKQKAAEAVIEQIPILLETFRAENGSFPATNTYTYTETDGGVITDNIGEIGVGKAGLLGLAARPKSYPANQGILYDYTLTIANSGLPNESATFFATPITSRGAPSGQIPAAAATYK